MQVKMSVRRFDPDVNRPESYFQEYDLLLCPTAPIPPHGHGVTELVIAGETVTPRNVGRATIPWDITGSPAISMPFAMSSGGLPIGLQLGAAPFGEETLFRAAYSYEQATPWHTRVAPAILNESV